MLSFVSSAGATFEKAWPTIAIIAANKAPFCSHPLLKARVYPFILVLNAVNVIRFVDLAYNICCARYVKYVLFCLNMLQLLLLYFVSNHNIYLFVYCREFIYFLYFSASLTNTVVACDLLSHFIIK